MSCRDAGYAEGPDPLSLVSLDKLRRQLEVNVTSQLQVTQVGSVLPYCHQWASEAKHYLLLSH